MNPLDQLYGYLHRLENRLRLGATASGAAAVAVCALLVTVLLVVIINRFAFSSASVVAARVVLIAALLGALLLGWVRPLTRLTRRLAARRAEKLFPEFQQRLLTLAECEAAKRQDPFLELLAMDTLQVAGRVEPERLFTRARLAGLASAALVAVGVLVWLGMAGPGYLGYGTALLWAGAPRSGDQPFYAIHVQPGDAKVRRKADQLVTAQVSGFQTQKVLLYARYHSSSKWEQVPMQPQLGGTGFEFLFAALPESVEYYVEAGAVRSRRFHIQAVDLPSIQRIRVTYHYPSWTGMGPETEENGGDLRAVQGTEAELTIEADRPLAEGVVVVDDQTRLPLQAAGGNRYTTRLRIEKDGLYHIAAVDAGQRVRLTEDYFIEARLEEGPKVSIRRPGRDYRATPIEEVAIEVEAMDDYGLQELTLHYSVNGGPERTAPLLRQKGARQAEGSLVLALEDFQLTPGDLVSVYATARDARQSTRTDMFFIEAQPFEREFSQSQTAGGAGGGGQQQDDQISARQKEIISATWNELRAGSGKRTEAAEIGKFLADVQGKLRDQARSLAQRMQSRELSTTNQEFRGFATEMNAAAEAMTSAAGHLKSSNWKEALAPEQKALQHLLRAEAMRRQIQVAFGARGGGGAGGGRARDLESLFDLELDTEKNQYETGQTTASADQRAREVDEALQKLEQLARRQQELAQQPRQNRQSFQQRWQQEMLRREAEQLQRQMEQLSRNGSRQGSSQQVESGQHSQDSSGGSLPGQASASGRQTPRRAGARDGSRESSIDPRLDRALERLRQATEDMRRAGQSTQPGSAGDAEARRAAERLQEATNLLGGMRREQAAGQLDELERRVEQLAGEHQQHAEQLRKLYGGQQQPSLVPQPGVSRAELERLAEQRKRMADELERIERGMQNAARDLAAGQRGASSKLREALGEMQQNELGLRLRYSAEWIRRGLGAYAWMREAPVSSGLRSLRDKVREAKQALGGGQPNQQQSLEQALERVERLRSRMEAMTGRQAGNAQQGQPGQQSRQGQPGPQGQGGQRGESAQGSGRSQQGQGQRGDGGQRMSYRGGGGDSRGMRDDAAMNRGDFMPEGPLREPGAGSAEAFDGGYRESLRDLAELRESVAGNPELARDIQALIREMQRLDPSRFPGNPQMVERLRMQVLAGLEQLELRLRREAEGESSGQVRSGASRPVPPGYQESVAEYFRRLSQGR